MRKNHCLHLWSGGDDGDEGDGGVGGDDSDVTKMMVELVVTELRYDLLETKVILWWKIYRNANNGFYVSTR